MLEDVAKLIGLNLEVLLVDIYLLERFFGGSPLRLKLFENSFEQLIEFFLV